MDENNILSISAIVLSIIGSIIAFINKKRIRSRCCGSQEIVIASIDIENTTPQEKEKSFVLKEIENK